MLQINTCRGNDVVSVFFFCIATTQVRVTILYDQFICVFNECQLYVGFRVTYGNYGFGDTTLLRYTVVGRACAKQPYCVRAREIVFEM